MMGKVTSNSLQSVISYDGNWIDKTEQNWEQDVLCLTQLSDHTRMQLSYSFKF